MTSENPNKEKTLDRQTLLRGEVSDELERKTLELSALFEISQLLNSSLNLVSIANHILLSPMGRLMISKGIFLLHRGRNEFEVYTLKGLPRELIGKRLNMPGLPFKPFMHQEISPSQKWMDFFEQYDLRLFFPVTLRNDVFGLIAYGKKMNGENYLESEIDFLSSVSSIAASSIQNGIVYNELHEVNQRLDKKIQELNTLFDIGKGLQASLDSKKILKLLSYVLMGEMMIHKYMILIRRNVTIELADNKGFASLSVPAGCDEQLFGISHPVLTDNQPPSELSDFLASADVRAVIPMRSQDQTKGILLTGARFNSQPFSDDDLTFLYTLGNQAMLSLENAWLFEDSLERRRLEEELELARQIQIGLLPKSFPNIFPFDVHGVNISSKQVGGDYFDVIRIDDDRYIVAIADVSGKGVPASLLMSNLQAGLLALSAEARSFDRLVARINNIIYANTGSDKFITFFGGILDRKNRTFTYVNAGHNPPYRVTAGGDLCPLEKGGLILGMIPDMEYEQDTLTLNSGESVVMFTDGVTEAMNAAGDLYDESRLEQLIRENHRLSPREICDFIVDSVSRFAGGAPQSDDITVVTLKMKN